MPKFIVLTSLTMSKLGGHVDLKDYFTMRVNIGTIRKYKPIDLSGYFVNPPTTRGVTQLYLGAETLYVLETPEQIDALINEANEADLARVRSIVTSIRDELLAELRKERGTE